MPHNLFWEVLELNMSKIRITEKAREIRKLLLPDPRAMDAWRDRRGLGIRGKEDQGCGRIRLDQTATGEDLAKKASGESLHGALN